MRYNNKHVRFGKLLPLVNTFWKPVYVDWSYDGFSLWQIGGHDGLMTSASSFAIYGNGEKSYLLY